MKNLTLKTRFLIGILIPLLVIFTFMFFIMNRQIKIYVENTLKETTMNQLKAHADKVSKWIEIYKVWVENISNHPELKEDLSKEEIAKWLKGHAFTGNATTLYSDIDGNASLFAKGNINNFSIKGQSQYKTIIEEKSNETFISNVFFSAKDNTPLITIAHGIFDKEKKVKAILNLAISTKILNKFSKEIKIGTGSIAWIVDGSGLFIAHPSEKIFLKMHLQDLNKVYNTKVVSDLSKTMLSKNEPGFAYGINIHGESSINAWYPIEKTPGWFVGITIPKKNFTSLSNKISYTFLGMASLSILVLMVIFFLVIHQLLFPVKKGVQIAQDIANFNLANTNRDTSKTYSKDEIGELTMSMDNMAEKLKNILKKIQESSNHISVSSKELQSSSRTISSGASEQAATLEEVAASILDVMNFIKTNVRNTNDTETIAQETVTMAKKTEVSSLETVSAMLGITEKIKVIQEIAGQTRLLSLNASIEAARAGSSGKGFAVVASEVSKLAELSANAAKEIDELSKKSVDATNHTQENLSNLIPQMQKATNLVVDISLANEEQNISMEQINGATQELNNIVQHNATQAEELAATAENFHQYATQLKNILSQFKV